MINKLQIQFTDAKPEAQNGEKACPSACHEEKTLRCPFQTEAKRVVSCPETLTLLF